MLDQNQKRIDELDQKRLREAVTELEFVECDTCRRKPGTPVLCQGCLINRQTIGHLHARLRVVELNEELKQAQRDLAAFKSKERSDDYISAREGTLREVVEIAQEEYKKLHSGGCHVLSEGDNCTCFLCKMDKLVESKTGTWVGQTND